jgi:hypothetical protein
MGKILDANRAGAGIRLRGRERVGPFTLLSILHADSWGNPWPDGAKG